MTNCQQRPAEILDGQLGNLYAMVLILDNIHMVKHQTRYCG